jgi:mono/diheme cytochrome c family protein
MPAWKGKLSDAQIDAVIEWMQSTWPDPVFAAWHEMQATNN